MNAILYTNRANAQHNLGEVWVTSVGRGWPCPGLYMPACVRVVKSATLWAAGNYRSALTDCALALQCNPGQVKAIYRAGQACFQLGKFTEVVRWCDLGLVRDAGSRSLLELRSRAAKQQVLRAELSEGGFRRCVMCHLFSLESV